MLAGQAPDDLGAALGLAEGALDEVRVPHPCPVILGEAQVSCERREVVDHACHRARIRAAPLVGERVGADTRLGKRGVAGLSLDVVEDRPVVGLELVLVAFGHLG